MTQPGGTAVTTETVEAVVRAQLSAALGGRRGMVEAAVPTVTFTLLYVTTKELRLAIAVSVAAAVVLLGVRLAQKGPVQYCVNALVGIGIGCLFVWLSGRGEGDESQRALAYFVPGMLYNAGYGALMVLSILVRWPLVGLVVGSVSEDPTGWRRDPQVVRLCSRLTWLLVLPCLLRLAVQAPVYLAGRAADDADPYLTALGVAKVAMGWPLQVAALTAMLWVLARNRTPVRPVASPQPVSGAG
ncbi:MAG: PROBABLE CONSERVED INTEGRAL MEMBRANE ALANINE AND LEUCINE RICH PROTEIN [uncultured Nocardioidaceae bacterium]|uniref:PROBABLE CONSERVED INTEGRAL MEMBRANE ALANINE AND LEUCINE RICH PROTEIN n=1 Tax=uncultured Nocardioidaceae bacterium TaxID=253824 RepID=A0A6J4LRZ8_9ACTN|nr:MAG: PROBABLE CONSERVED INTEGRAL MEMBRANE ALANINE AND LEUCINE RICH PROTEIN [uncultured Nocardioidaceae bacterium]